MKRRKGGKVDNFIGGGTFFFENLPRLEMLKIF